MEINTPTAIVIAGFEGDHAVITRALRSPDPQIRCAALGASHRSKLLSSDILRPFLSDESFDVRYRAIELCARTGDGHFLAGDIAQMLTQEDLAEVAAFVLGELGETGQKITEALCAQAELHNNPLCRESAVAALGALGTGRSTVLRATEDIATVRRRAIICLAAFEGPDVDAALQIALADRDWQVRQAAEDLVGIATE